VVTVNSALRPNHRHLDIWPVDHAGEIGWSLALLNPFTRNRAIAEHLERYDSIIDKIQENEIKKQKAAAGG